MSRSKPTRAQIRAFGKQVKRGDVFYNRFHEHEWSPGARHLTVVMDVPGKALFVLKDQWGRITTMRGKTLMVRYSHVKSGPPVLRTGD